jgi:hypothetical protein
MATFLFVTTSVALLAGLMVLVAGCRRSGGQEGPQDSWGLIARGRVNGCPLGFTSRRPRAAEPSKELNVGCECDRSQR